MGILVYIHAVYHCTLYWMIYVEMVVDPIQHPSTWQFRKNEQYRLYKVYVHTQIKSDPGFVYSWFTKCILLGPCQVVLRIQLPQECAGLQPSTVREARLKLQRLKVRRSLHMPCLMAWCLWSQIIRLMMMMMRMVENLARESKDNREMDTDLERLQTQRPDILFDFSNNFFMLCPSDRLSERKKRRQILTRWSKGVVLNIFTLLFGCFKFQLSAKAQVFGSKSQRHCECPLRIPRERGEYLRWFLYMSCCQSRKLHSLLRPWKRNAKKFSRTSPTSLECTCLSDIQCLINLLCLHKERFRNQVFYPSKYIIYKMFLYPKHDSKGFRVILLSPFGPGWSYRFPKDKLFPKSWPSTKRKKVRSRLGLLSSATVHVSLLKFFN